jgi:hypothetical protein
LGLFAIQGDTHFKNKIKTVKKRAKAKKEQGVKLGRPKGTGKSKLDKFKPEIEALLQIAH